MSATDLTFTEIQARVYQELKTVATSNAYTTQHVKDLINEGYNYTFNRLTQYLAEGFAEFQIIPDATLTTAIVVGDVTVTVSDSSSFASAGIIIVGEDIITYTGNTGTVFTGCTGINHSATTDVPVRPGYSLNTLASDIDSQQLYPINVNGQPYDYMSPNEFFDRNYDDTYKFTILNDYLIFPTNSETINASFRYLKIPTVMTADDDKPSLLPNNFRYELLMPYTVGWLLIGDDERTGWDKYFNYNARSPGSSSGLYFDNLRGLKSRYNRRVIPNRKYVGSIFD